MKRTVVRIDEKRCNGCGLCVTGCHEGALQIVGGKAVMVREDYCDGLGACIPECPRGAISLEEREADPFDQKAVQEHMLQTVQQQQQPVRQQPVMFPVKAPQPVQFPVQLHLINPQNTLFRGADLLLAAVCTAFTTPDFHTRYLKNKLLAIACPKLDSNCDVYVEKLAVMIEETGIETLTVLIMEVPCCGGLLEIVKKAREKSSRYIPVKKIILTIQGNLKSEEWIK
ncbi:MAG TPA: 4Fe-4S binding protein [Bacteroidales bacterium]|nr:4Fe-4S binding protein [Bacteroidales bacterium]